MWSLQNPGLTTPGQRRRNLLSVLPCHTVGNCDGHHKLSTGCGEESGGVFFHTSGNATLKGLAKWETRGLPG